MNENLTELIYLDNAATTQLDENVLTEMLPYMTKQYGNPSSIHTFGVQARVAIEKARKNIGNLLGVKAQSIIFTSGGTESNNMAILAAIRDLKCNHIITSKIEHHAVLHTIEHYSKFFGFEISYVSLNLDGSINHRDFERLLMTKTSEEKRCLVSLMHANNEIGNLTDIALIGSICKKYGAIFHSDCVQTIGHYQLNLSELNVHLASASAHKFHGPKGVGILYVNELININPLIYGGSQERNHRAGTENVAGIVGMAKALSLSYEHFAKQKQAVNELKQYFISRLINSFPGVIINGSNSTLYSILSVSFLKTHRTESILMKLDSIGICASGGSACSSGGSHVAELLGRALNYTTIRFSFSRYNTKSEINCVFEVLKIAMQPELKLS